MARHAIIEFVDDLCGYFGPPKPANGQSDDAYLKSWMRYAMDDFGSYSADELMRAFKILRSTSKYKSMPSNAEIIEACKEAVKQINIEKPKFIDTRTRSERTHDAKERIALDLIRCDMGRTASKEGWIGELFAYVRDNGHMPRTNAEIRTIVADAEETDRVFNGLVCGDIRGHERLIGLGESMMQRRKALADYILHGKQYTWGQP